MARETGAEARGQLATADHERICVVCHRRYRDETSHVATDIHLEAMADETVREWIARSPNDPVSIDFARQIARLEFYYDSPANWRASMSLPDTPETELLARRIRWCWIKAMGLEDFDERMRFARVAFRLEALGLVMKGAKTNP